MRALIGFGVLAAGAVAAYAFLNTSEPEEIAVDPATLVDNLQQVLDAETSLDMAASEADYRAVAEALDGVLDVTIGGFDTEDGMTIARDVRITVPEVPDVGMQIDVLAAWGLDAAAAAALHDEHTRSTDVQLAERLDARGVSMFGADVLIDQFINTVAMGVDAELGDDTDTDQIAEVESDDVVNVLTTPSEVEIDTIFDNSFSITQYTATTERLVVDGFTLHLEPPITVQTDDEFMVAPAKVAHGLRMVSIDSIVAETTNGSLVMETEYATISVDLDFPLYGYQGWSRGGFDTMAMKNYAMTVTTSFPADEFNSQYSTDESYTADLYVWENFDVSRALAFLERGEIPPVTATNIVNYGRAQTRNETQSFNGVEVLTTGSSSVEFGDAYWFIPTEISFSGRDVRLSTRGLWEAMKPEFMAEQSLITPTNEDVDPIDQDVERILSVIDEQGLSTLTFQYDGAMNWSPLTGDTSLALDYALENFGQTTFSIDGTIPTFEQFYQAYKSDTDDETDVGGAAAVTAALLSALSLSEHELTIEDQGGMDATFRLASAFAEMSPEELDPAAVALLNAEPQDVRNAVAGLMTVAATQVGEQFPPAVDYIQTLGAFIQSGGTIRMRIDPPQPLTQESFMAFMQTGVASDPEAIVNFVGFSLEHEPHAEEAADASGE